MKSYGQLPDVVRRLAKRRRAALVKSVAEARWEFKAGKLYSVSPAEIMRKVLA